MLSRPSQRHLNDSRGGRNAGTGAMKRLSLSGLCWANYRTGRQSLLSGETVISLVLRKEEEWDAWDEVCGSEAEIMAGLYTVNARS